MKASRSKVYLEKYARQKSGGACELCGRKTGVEAHHIIPRVCGGPDIEDNILAVCSVCHAKLTPRSLLTKYGLHKYDGVRLLLIGFYTAINDDLNDGSQLSASDVLDLLKTEVIDNVFRL